MIVRCFVVDRIESGAAVLVDANNARSPGLSTIEVRADALPLGRDAREGDRVFVMPDVFAAGFPRGRTAPVCATMRDAMLSTVPLGQDYVEEAERLAVCRGSRCSRWTVSTECHIEVGADGQRVVLTPGDGCCAQDATRRALPWTDTAPEASEAYQRAGRAR